MELARTVVFIFEDKKWLSKLLPLLGLGVLALIPVVGLLALALELGYMLQMACNVRDGLPRPLPKWDGLEEKFSVGGQLTLAIIVYNMPLILMSICSWTLISGIAGGFLGPFLNFVVVCCTLPLILVYTVLAWAILGIGVTEYLQTGDSGRLYRIGHLWDVLQANSGIVWQWVFYGTVLNVALGLMGAIPCIGQIALLLFYIPVQGHLFGQFAHKLGLVNKPQIKRRKKA